MHACHLNEYGDYKYDKYKVSIVNECVMAENEPITSIIFVREHFVQAKPGGRTFLSRRERSSRRECIYSRALRRHPTRGT